MWRFFGLKLGKHVGDEASSVVVERVVKRHPHDGAAHVVRGHPFKVRDVQNELIE